MKRTFLLIASVLAVSCFTSQAAEASKPHELEYRDTEKFTRLIGLDLLNLQGEKLGKIKYITADLENARLVEIIVTTKGGLWGLGTRVTAVPPRACTLDEVKNVMYLDVSKEKFAGAPNFDESDMTGSSQRDKVAAVNRYFGLEPWFFTEGQTVKKNTQILRLGFVQRTDRLIGLPISNKKGESIGRIETLTMDLPKGQILHVVAVTDAKASPRSIIQARALRFNADHTSLVLDDTIAELAGEPHFKWLNGKSKSFKQESYVNREVEADKGLHSKQNAQEGIVHKSVSMEEGENFRDKQKTQLILQAIQADPTLSENAKNVEVVTLNGQTTLRGHVNTAAGKKRIGEIAMKAGQPENVSNLLEVRALK